MRSNLPIDDFALCKVFIEITTSLKSVFEHLLIAVLNAFIRALSVFGSRL